MSTTPTNSTDPDRIGGAEYREELLFTTPDTVRTKPIRDDAAILAFEATWEGLSNPDAHRLDRFDLRMMVMANQDAAFTTFLRELAEW
jgi:hypothetical protein